MPEVIDLTPPEPSGGKEAKESIEGKKKRWITKTRVLVAAALALFVDFYEVDMKLKFWNSEVNPDHNSYLIGGVRKVTNMSDYLNKSNLRSMLEDPGTPTLVILKQAANVLRAVQRDVFQGEDRKEAIELLHAAYDRVTATRGVSMVEAASGHSGKYFVYRLENEHEKAAREAVRATALWPASDVLRCNAGLESEANGELGDALHQYRMCDSRKPGQPEVRAAITRLEAEIGDFGK